MRGEIPPSPPLRKGGAGRSRGLAALACLVLLAGMAAAQDEEVEYALEKPLAARSLLLDGVAVDGLMVAVGERGHVLFSRDEGESWQQASSVPTRATLTAVYFHDAQLGWAVGHDAVILRTRDGGDTWERLYHAPEEERPFLDVWFEDDLSGFAVGAYGFFLKTTDGGDTWTPHEFVETSEVVEEDDPYAYDEGGDFHLNHIAQAQDGRLYMAAEAGTVYRSDDGGEIWKTLPSPYTGSFFGTLPLDGDSLLLFGLRGNLFRSEDAGESWQTIDSGTEAVLSDGLLLSDGTVVLAGAAGTLLISGDGGETFRLAAQADRQALATVLSAGDSLVLVGEFGVNKIPVPTP